MEFSMTIQESRSSLRHLVYRDDVPDILEPFFHLPHLYSTHHIRRTKNDNHNNVYAKRDTLVEDDVMCDLSISLLEDLCFDEADTLYAYGHDPYSQRPLVYGYTHYCISEPEDRDNDVECRPSIPDNDISSPIQHDNLNDLNYDHCVYNSAWCKVTYIYRNLK